MSKARGTPRDWAPSPRQIEAALLAAKEAVANFTDKEREDYKLLVDTIDGESNLLELLDRIAHQYKADDLLVGQAKQRIKRLAARAEKARDLYERIAEAAGLTESIERPFYLANYEDDVPHAVITDEAAIPREFMRPDKTEIAKRLRRKEEIPGAVLSNPGRHLTLRWI